MRIDACKKWLSELSPSSPYYVDCMEDSTRLAFASLPERVYVIGEDAKVVVKGGEGPFGYDLEVVREYLDNKSGQK